jgi:hypothetical protein
MGVLAALLLPLPMVLVLGIALQGSEQTGSPGREQVSPMLSHEERLSLKTYLRDCSKSEECEPPLGCFNHWRLKKPHCSDSDCVTDMQCREGETCQTLPTEGNGPWIRVCIAQGVRREGEECDSFPRSQDEACGAGLFCRAGRCSRACSEHTPGTCPEGFFCATHPAGSVCLPTCEERVCPAGQQCVHFNLVGAQQVSACVVVHGENCKRVGCPEGQECVSTHGPRRPGDVWMNCRARCDRPQAQCPEGLICSRAYCVQPCDPQEPQGCGPDQKCQQLSRGESWACWLDIY